VPRAEKKGANGNREPLSVPVRGEKKRERSSRAVVGARAWRKREGTVIESRRRCPCVEKKRGNGHREPLSVPVRGEKKRERSSRAVVGARARRKKEGTVIESRRRCPCKVKKEENGNRELVLVPVRGKVRRER